MVVAAVVAAAWAVLANPARRDAPVTRLRMAA
jgi:hypothetical protein